MEAEAKMTVRRLKVPEEPRPLTREECIVKTVLGIIGGATVIEDGIERQIGPHDIQGVRPVVVHPTKRAERSRHGYKAAQFKDAFARFLPPEPNIRTLKHRSVERT